MRDAIIAGLISGLMSPLILSLIQHKLIWKRQKKFEIRYTVFSDAVRALGQLSTDALDPRLQGQKAEYKGRTRIVELRPETSELMERSRGMVNALFSDRASSAFDKALATEISIEEVPCIEFEENRTDAIIRLSEELGIR